MKEDVLLIDFHVCEWFGLLLGCHAGPLCWMKLCCGYFMCIDSRRVSYTAIVVRSPMVRVSLCRAVRSLVVAAIGAAAFFGRLREELALEAVERVHAALTLRSRSADLEAKTT